MFHFRRKITGMEQISVPCLFGQSLCMCCLTSAMKSEEHVQKNCVQPPSSKVGHHSELVHGEWGGHTFIPESAPTRHKNFRFHVHLHHTSLLLLLYMRKRTLRPIYFTRKKTKAFPPFNLLYLEPKCYQ